MRRPNPVKRPLNFILLILSLSVGLYLYVVFAYFQINPLVPNSPPTPKPTTINQKILINNKEIILSPPTPQKEILRNDTNYYDLVTAIVECQTSHGNLTIDLRENWAPLGVKRFLELIERGLFTNSPFFRVCPRYITQFGVKYGWKGGMGNIPDDPSLWGKRDMNFGYLFFAVDLVNICIIFLG